jgi:hypothetical protein
MGMKIKIATTKMTRVMDTGMDAAAVISMTVMTIMIEIRSGVGTTPTTRIFRLASPNVTVFPPDWNVN